MVDVRQFDGLRAKTTKATYNYDKPGVKGTIDCIKLYRVGSLAKTTVNGVQKPLYTYVAKVGCKETPMIAEGEESEFIEDVLYFRPDDSKLKPTLFELEGLELPGYLAYIA